VILFFIELIAIVTRLIFLLVLVHVILSYFMSPFHPIRQTVDRVVEPMLAPIRQLIPPVGMIDFSPLILIILVQLVGSLLRNLLLSFV
jgi:YggT family protein